MSRGHYSHSVRGLSDARNYAVNAMKEKIKARASEISKESSILTEAIQEDAKLTALLELIYDRTRKPHFP